MKEEQKEKQYLKIYESLRKDIEEGLYAPGMKLASKRTMARDLGVSVITVEHALQLLEDEGYVTAKERSGCFVTYDEAAVFPVESAEHMTRSYWPDVDSDETGFPFSAYAKTARRVLSTYGEAVLQRCPNFGTEILRTALSERDWQDKLKHLVSIALENGGADNITALFAVVEEAAIR